MRKNRIERDNLVPVRQKQRKSSSGKRKVLLAVCILLLIAMSAIIIGQCQIEEIIVNGNETYTKDEVEASVRENGINNTVFYTALSLFTKNDYLPFVERLHITFLGKNSILVDVEEKLRAGMIQEMSEFCYFDKDGTLLETSSVRIKDVPLITGLQMNGCVLNEKIEPKEENVFPVILKMTQLIMKYEIPVSEIQFNTISDIRIRSNSIWVDLGDSKELDAKMAELPSVLESLYGKQGELNMEHYSEENKVISFKAN